MGKARERIAFAAVLAAHVALFVLLAWGLRPRPERAAPEVTVAPVYLADLHHKRRPDAPSAAASDRSLPVLSRPAETAPSAQAPVPAKASSDDARRAEAETQRLARSLRAGRVGCANPSLLNDAERLACEERLGRGAELAKYIPAPIPPERRAFYDAIVREKAAIPASAVVRSAGAPPIPGAGLTGVLASEASGVRAMGGKAAGVGCAMAFGGPKGTNGWKKPPNALKLGPLPCYVTPPTSPWAPEASIQNPDEVVKGQE